MPSIYYPNETYDGEVARVACDATGKVTGIYAPNSEVQWLVVSADAPSDSDGRPDGTIYIQTA